jgi:DNA polymerase
MDILAHDFETYSEVDLRKVGASYYSRHPSTEILMCAYSFNSGPIRQWVPAEGEPMPRELREAMDDPEVIKQAWNAHFELNIWRNTAKVKTPVRQWRCMMVLAMSLSFPGALEDVGPIVDIPPEDQKDPRGDKFIHKFSKPRKPTANKPWARATHKTDPEDWADYKSYNRQDVRAEEAIGSRILKYDMPWDEWELWFEDQEINECGIPINQNMVRNAIKLTNQLTEVRLDEMAKITGLDNPNSQAQLYGWLKARKYQFLDLKAGHVRRALEDEKKFRDRNEDVIRVLELRLETSQASVKKYKALEISTDSDGNMRGGLQFYGAQRTGRWSGRRFQAQNLKRPSPEYEKIQETIARQVELWKPDTMEMMHDKPFDVLSTTVRNVVQAPKGKVLIWADLNAIENRVLGWMADEQRILDVFRNDRDPYIDFATFMYDWSYKELFEEWKSGKKGKRQLAKPPVLGCGYALGPGKEVENEQTGEMEATGLLGYAWNMGVMMTLDEATRAVKVWRDTYSDVLEFWKEIDRAARKCLRTGERTYCQMLEFDMKGPFLRMRLPSGRHLWYFRPKIERRKTPWGEMRPTVTYMGLDLRNQWVRLGTHPGKLTENADQSISRDLLANGIQHARREGLEVRFHVHDEIIALTDEDRAEKDMKLLVDCMCRPAKWNRDLPLKAEGKFGRVWVKD